MNQQNINPEQDVNPLESYGMNLTDLAQNGKIDPVIGRDDEIRRMVQILSRRNKMIEVFDLGDEFIADSVPKLKNLNQKPDHLLIDAEWFKHQVDIFDYLGVKSSDVLTETASLYGKRYNEVVEAYEDIRNKYYK